MFRCIILTLSISAAHAQSDSSHIISRAQLKSRNTTVTPRISQLLPSDHYAKNLGFMCKKELQIQKAVKLPIFFRLGSIDYSNYLEGKGKLQ